MSISWHFPVAYSASRVLRLPIRNPRCQACAARLTLTTAGSILKQCESAEQVRCRPKTTCCRCCRAGGEDDFEMFLESVKARSHPARSHSDLTSQGELKVNSSTCRS